MSQSTIAKISERLFRMLCSLKLAVLIILSLAIALATATILESVYDTQTAQYWVYRSLWFHLLLSSLGVNIFCVAVSRYPWKKHHIPFLLAHLGILILLAGSWITERAGIDGSLRVTEGETASVVELDSSALLVSDSSRVYAVPVHWIPPNVTFKAIQSDSYRVPYHLTIDRFLSHADSSVSFVPESTGAQDEKSTTQSPYKKGLPAVHLRIVGGPMAISQDFWLWEGSPGWRAIQMGPAHFELGFPEKVVKQGTPSMPRLFIQAGKDGGLSYRAISSSGEKTSGKIVKSDVKGFAIQPGWKGNVKIIVEDVILNAVPLTTYKPARIQYGNQAPPSAIHVTASPTAEVWLGLGDRAILTVDGREVEIGYFPRRIVLPFSIRLEKFTVDHNPGTLTPAAYSSRVTALNGKDQKEVTISMNEPLELRNYTIYQASYEEGDPRPMTSIFSVNQDPGRKWKYFGSFLIVLGSILLFAAKYKKARKVKKSESFTSSRAATLSEVL